MPSRWTLRYTGIARGVLVSAILCMFATPFALAADPIRIGHVAALSGASAQSGEAITRGLQLAIDDINGHYLVTARTAIFWPFDENGVLIGEDSYGSSDVADCQRVPNDELPAEYVAMLDAIGYAPASA